MSARVAQTPPAPYRPRGSTDCMWECLECHVEGGWGASFEKCQEFADEHNRTEHPEESA